MRRGGCAVRKSREATLARADGVVLINQIHFVDQHHPVLNVSPYRAHASRRSVKGGFATLLLMSRPPLLSFPQLRRGVPFGCFAAFQVHCFFTNPTVLTAEVRRSEGVDLTLCCYYKSSRLKQYFKEGKALRIKARFSQGHWT